MVRNGLRDSLLAFGDLQHRPHLGPAMYINKLIVKGKARRAPLALSMDMRGHWRGVFTVELNGR